MTDIDLERDLLLKARNKLIDALEADGAEITGHGFGMGGAALGEAHIDLEVDGRNFCVNLKLTDLDRLDDEDDRSDEKGNKQWCA